MIEVEKGDAGRLPEPGEEQGPVEVVATLEEAPPPLIDRVIEGLLGWWGANRSWLPLMVAIGASPGLFLWPLLIPEESALLDNRLANRSQVIVGVSLAVSLLIAVGFYSLVAKRAKGDRVERLAAWNERLLPLLLLPLLPVLLTPEVESKRPWSVILVAAAGALVCAISIYRRPWRLPSLPTWLPGAMAIAFGGAWVLKLSLLAIGQHHGLETEVFDLGIYDSIFWNSIHGKPLASTFMRGGTHVSGHVDPILVLLSPLYLLYPRAESILVLQVVWVAAGAIPVWLLAQRLLGRGHALGLVIVYLLLPSIHGRTLYHFHSLTLAGPLLLWCFACLELRWLRAFWLPLALLLLTREDMALLAMVLGAYAIVGKGYRRLGLWTIGIAAAYLVFVKFFVMPDPSLLGGSSSESYGFAYYYEDMIPRAKMGTLGLLLSLVTNPVFVLHHVLTEPKLRTFALLFLPLLFLPFFAQRGRMLLAYGLAFIFLASREPVFSIGFQYATVLDSLALGVTVIAIAESGKLRLPFFARLEEVSTRRALTAAMVVASALLSAKFGALLPSTSFRAGFHKLVREPSEELQERYAWVRQAADRIGPSASVSATGRLGPHVSNRAQAYLWPNGGEVDYLLLERRRLRGKALEKFRKVEREGSYRIVDRHGSYLLLERADRLPPTPPPATAEERLELPTRRLPILERPAERFHLREKP